MIYKKSVVLSCVRNTLKKAVVNLSSKSGNIKGEVKLYNFIEEPMGVLSLGFLIDGKIQKAGLTRVGYMNYSFGSVLTRIPEHCTCVLSCSKGGNTDILLVGAISGNSANMEERLIASLSAKEQTSMKKAEQILKEQAVEFDDEKEIENQINQYFDKYPAEDLSPQNDFHNFEIICEKQNEQQENFQKSLDVSQQDNNEILKEDVSDKIFNGDFENKENPRESMLGNNQKEHFPYEESCASCGKCAYKQAFYEESALSLEKKEKREKLASEENFLDIKETYQPDIKFQREVDLKEQLRETKKNIKSGRIRKPELENSMFFFDEISSQLKLLFETYPEESVLSQIIPASKWVKVDFEEDGRYYVVGLIYVENEVKYVCYGIPAVWSSKPPADFNENAQWLPINVSNPTGLGYWLTYQDAIDGEMVKVDIV